MKSNMKKTFNTIVIALALVAGFVYLPSSASAAGYCDSSVSVDLEESYNVQSNGETAVVGWQADYNTYEPEGGRNIYQVTLYRNGQEVRTWSADTNSYQQPPESGSYSFIYTGNNPVEFSVTASVVSEVSCPDGVSDSDSMSVLPPVNNPDVECIINYFYADNSNPENGQSTNLRFGLNKTSNWSISLMQGSGLPSPYLGTASSGVSNTGPVTEYKVYKLTCGSAYEYVGVTPPTENPGGGVVNTCNDPAALNYGGSLPCNYPSYCSNPAATNYGGSLPCTYQQTCSDLAASNYGEPLPCDYNPFLTPSVSAPACVPVGDSTYDATLSWRPVQNNIRIFVDDNFNTPEGFDKVLYGTPGSTPAPSGFTQRIPTGPQTLTFGPGQTFYSFIQNDSTQEGTTISWSVPQCVATTQAQGYLDAGTCDAFGGWAWDPDYPDNAISLQIYVDDVHYDELIAIANAYRADLPGNKYHAFGFNTPNAWKDGQSHTIKIYAMDLNGDGNPQLVGSPKTITCSTPVQPVLNLSANGCQISNGQSSCTGGVTWGIDNVSSGQGATLTKTPDGSTISTATSGSLSPTLSRGSTTFALSHAGLSANQTVTADCDLASGSTWNGSVCVAPPAFNYTLSNSGTSSVTKSSNTVYTTNTITVTKTSGSTQAVSLSLSGVPSGVSYSISPTSCNPNGTCNMTATFNVSPSAIVGNHNITVTGSPLGRTTSFTLAIAGSPISLSCTAAPSTALVGQSVTWTGNISGGTPPFTYSWSGTNMPTPAPSTNPYTRTYSTVGQKTAQLTVTDADGLQTTCPAGTVQINFNPNFEEF